MKAPVLFEQRAPLRVEELEVEPPREDEVSVRMVASGVCHSCLHAADGSWQGIPLPIVLGDEGSGIVEDFPRLVELYLAGKLRLDDLITRRYSIDEADQAFRDLAAGALARGLIVF
jgi:Zn-dependent alcohol dehydrogenase